MAGKIIFASIASLFAAVNAQTGDLRQEQIQDQIPVVSPSFQSPSVHWADLHDALPAVPATIEPFEDGWAFQSCSSSPTSYDYYNLLFEDCPEPWQVCLAKESNLTIDDVVDVSLGPFTSLSNSLTHEPSYSGEFQLASGSTSVISKYLSLILPNGKTQLSSCQRTGGAST